jgi:hypothetical protein
MSRKPLNRSPRGPLFIGWAAPTDPVRRGVLLGGLGLAVSAGGLAAVAGAMQNPPGPGQWDTAAIRDWRGRLSVDPFPTLSWRDAAGRDHAALLGCPDKCGVAAQVQRFAGQGVSVRGSLIRRGGLEMIAVADEPVWIRPAPDTPETAALPAPPPARRVVLEGELMDAKCWLGAMRPGEGLTHKSCAILCVRMGLPLLFVAGTPGGPRRALVATDPGGRPLGVEILPFVADPVRVAGMAVDGPGWPRLAMSAADVVRL